MDGSTNRRLRAPALAVVATLCAGMLIAVVPARIAHAAGFTSGNLVVERVGDGSGALSGATAPVFLDEVTTAGAVVQSIALPTADSAPNHALTSSGTAASEGGLSLSGDGHSLSLEGYDLPVGTGGASGTGGVPPAQVARTVGIVSAAGAVDTSTALGDAYQKNNPRGAVTDGKGNIWTGGAGGLSGNVDGGIRYAADGATTSTPVVPISGTGNLTNTRVPEIDGGQLYVSTDRVPNGSGLTNAGIFRIGTGLPTGTGNTATLITTTGLPANGQTGAALPLGYAFVDRDNTVAGDDTLYVADQAHGIAKYSTADGTTWTFRGEYTTSGGYTGIAATTDNSGNAVLYATNAAETQLQTLTDTAAFNATINIASAPTTIETAGANESLRGVAWAPTAPPVGPSIGASPQNATVPFNGSTTLSVSATGTSPLHYQWYQGDASDISTPVGTDSDHFTTPALTATTDYWVRVSNSVSSQDSTTAIVTVSADTPPTISTPTPLANALSDPANPSTSVTVGDAESPVASLTVTATASTNPAVATVAGVNITGSGATRTVTVTPAGAVGYADITLEVSDGTNTTDTTLHYAVSAASGTPATTRYYAGSSDASTEQDVGGGYMLVGDDENQALRLYDTTVSGLPVNSFDYSNMLNLPGGKEVDIEASARVGNVIYWLGSESNNSDGSARPARDRVYATQVTGTGASTTLTFIGYYDQLKEDLLNWDAGNGNQFNFATVSAPGVPSEGSNQAFNIEGLEFAPGSTSTAYVSFRAPIVGPNNQALIVPVTNFDQLTNGVPGTTHATFGTPILLNLGGRGIREIRKNADDQYLIIAGPAVDGGPSNEALYTWDGVAGDAPVLQSTDLTPPTSAGPYEGIVSVPDPLTAASQFELLADSGDTVWYNDGTIAKDLSVPEFKKADGDLFTLGGAVQNIAPVNSVPGPQSTQEDAALTFSAANNNAITVSDADSEGNAERVEVSVLNGTLTLGSTNGVQQTGNGTNDVTVTAPLAALNAALDGLTYQPSSLSHGPDTLTVLSNDLGNSNAGGALTDTDTVGITVNFVDHAPVATADSYITNENVPINNGQVLTNDSDVDNDTLNAVQVTGPSNGLLTLHSDGSFIYTPSLYFHGDDSFTYKANDGTLDSNVVTVSITVRHVNQPPVGVDDFYQIPENQTLSGNVVANDQDIDGNSLIAFLNDSQSHGTMTLHTDGTFIYSPDPNYFGTDSFTYFADDGTSFSQLVTVHINVVFQNHPPVAVDDSVDVVENQTVSGNVLSNDTDVDAGQVLSATLNDSPSNGNLTLQNTGIFTYSPNPGFIGTDTFTYFASDGRDFSNLATVTITVHPSPSAPTNVSAISGNKSATVSWTAAAGNGAPITGYTVTPYIGFVAQPSTTFNSAATTETVTGLTNGTSYRFTVSAVNAYTTGPQSTASAATLIGLPSAPTNIVGTPGNGSVSVAWTAPSGNGSNISGYVVTPYIGTTAQTAHTFNTTATTQVITGLTNGTTYTFKVAAINGVGTGAQGVSAPVTAGAPTAPRSPSATAAAASAKVKWTAPASTNGSNITGYIVTVYSGGVVVKTVTFNTAATTETVSGLTKGHTYTFTVAAKNAKGTGPASVMTNAVVPT